MPKTASYPNALHQCYAHIMFQGPRYSSPTMPSRSRQTTHPRPIALLMTCACATFAPTLLLHLPPLSRASFASCCCKVAATLALALVFGSRQLRWKTWPHAKPTSVSRDLGRGSSTTSSSSAVGSVNASRQPVQWPGGALVSGSSAGAGSATGPGVVEAAAVELPPLRTFAAILGSTPFGRKSISLR